MYVRNAMPAAGENRWLRHPKGESHAYIYTDRSILPSLREAVYNTSAESGPPAPPAGLELYGVSRDAHESD